MPDFQDHATAVRAGEELNLAALETFLQEHFPGDHGPLEVKQFPSGHSNSPVQFDLAPGNLYCVALLLAAK